MTSRLVDFGAEHWFVVALNALISAWAAAFFATILVFMWGLASGFVSVWRKSRFRHSQYPAAAWGFAWALSLLGNLGERLLSRDIGGLKPHSLAPLAGDAQPHPRVAVFVHGTFGRLQNYDWKRWAAVASAFPIEQWQLFRFAWNGGNTTRARQRAAHALADHVRQLRAKHPGGTIVLVGHSHGGSVCEEAARLEPVEAVVPIATPHTGPEKTPQPETILLGVFARALGPVFVAGVLALLGVWSPLGSDRLAGPGTIVKVWYSALAVILASLIWRLVTGNAELSRRMESAGTPMRTPRVLCIQTADDFILAEATLLQQRVHGIARILKGLTRQQEIARQQAGGLLSWGLEAMGFALVGAVIIFGGAVLITAVNLPAEVRDAIAPWVFPAANFIYLKFVVYTVAIAIPFYVLRRIFHRPLLPSWHFWAFRLGRRVAIAVRMSQLFSFKAGLLGMRGLALHVHDIPIIASPDGATLHIAEATQPTTGLALHSIVISLPDTVSAIRRLASDLEQSKDFGQGHALPVHRHPGWV